MNNARIPALRSGRTGITQGLRVRQYRLGLFNHRVVKGGATTAVTLLGLLALYALPDAEQPTIASLAVPADLEAELHPGSMSLGLWSSDISNGAEAAPVAVEQIIEVRSGDTLMALLTEAGVDRGEAHEAITALADLYSPRHLQPGQAIRLAFSPEPADDTTEGRLMWVVLQPDVEHDIQVARAPHGGFIATAVDRILVRELTGAAGTIDSSLFEAALDAEVPMPIVLHAIHVFSFEVDFQRDIHPGDGFSLLYESYSDEAGMFAKTGPVLYASLMLGGKQHELYRFTTSEGRIDYFNADGESVRRTLMRTPINGARLSSGFGMRRHPVLGYSRMHRGVDFAAPTGTPIYAAGHGVVARAGRWGAYGNYIRIRHNSTYQTAYAHLSRFASGVRPGLRVEQGQVIGYVGTTGRSTGPHLHYEVLVSGKQVNPRKLNLPTGQKLEHAELARFQVEREKIDRLREAVLDTPRVARSTCSEGISEEGSATGNAEAC